jgi:CheY-like chemotaxis protein
MTFAVTPHPLSILVVDDEQPIRELLRWMLGDAGHVVYEASEGQEALDFLRGDRSVDIVLSDINMPGMDGLELSKCVWEQWPDLPVLLISGRPPPVGVRAFIAKPFRWDVLANAIAMLAGPDRSQPGCA